MYKVKGNIGVVHRRLQTDTVSIVHRESTPKRFWLSFRVIDISLKIDPLHSISWVRWYVLSAVDPRIYHCFVVQRRFTVTYCHPFSEMGDMKAKELILSPRRRERGSVPEYPPRLLDTVSNLFVQKQIHVKVETKSLTDTVTSLLILFLY